MHNILMRKDVFVKRIVKNELKTFNPLIDLDCEQLIIRMN